jgi:hypothetical protein
MQSQEIDFAPWIEWAHQEVNRLRMLSGLKPWKFTKTARESSLNGSLKGKEFVLIVEVWTLKRGSLTPPEPLPSDQQFRLNFLWEEADETMTDYDRYILSIAKMQKWPIQA